MNPLALLRLWRQRWGIVEGVADGATAHVMLDRGDWGMSVVSMGLWSSRLMTAFATLLGLLLLATAGLMVFHIEEQVALGLLVVALAIYIRCYRGLLAFLALGGLTILCGVRYLSWRWQYTLPEGSLYPLGIGLLLAEVAAFLAFAVWLARAAWPLNQEPVAMPDNEQDWPYIDLVLVAPLTCRLDLAELESVLAGQRWPTGRMRVFVQDASADGELRAACRRLGFTHVVGQGSVTPGKRPLSLDAELPQGNGEYILVFEADSYAELRDDPLLLQRWVAWLRNDAALGLLYTPGHPVAASLSIKAEDLRLQGTAGSLALIRRVAWKAQGHAGLDNFVERLEAADYCTALVGHPLDATVTASPATGVSWVRIDDVGDGRSVLQRQGLNRAAQALHTLLPWVLGAMAIGVLAIPLTGVLLIHATLPRFAAYVMPYAAMMFLAWSDALNLRRLDIGSEIREWMLALVLPVIVAARALFVGFKRRLARVEASKKTPWSVTLHVRLVVYLMSLALALVRLATTADAALLPWLAVVAIIIIYATALTLSSWAAGLEARSLRDTFAAQACGLLTPSGRVLSCTALNFPMQPLQLQFDEQLGESVLGFREMSGPDQGSSTITLIIGTTPAARIYGSISRTGARSARLKIAAGSQSTFVRATHRARARLLNQKYWLPGPDLGFTALNASEFQ